MARRSDSERLDGENGLLLTPSIDHSCSIARFISFETDGRLLVSRGASQFARADGCALVSE